MTNDLPFTPLPEDARDDGDANSRHNDADDAALRDIITDITKDTATSIIEDAPHTLHLNTHLEQ